MNRRSFLASILAAGVAPAVVGSGILMPVRQLWTPPLGPVGIDCTGPGPGPEGPFLLYGDGIHDDTVAMQAILDGKYVINREGRVLSAAVGLTVLITDTLYMCDGKRINDCLIRAMSPTSGIDTTTASHGEVCRNVLMRPPHD